MGYSLQGLNNYIASEASKTYWLNKIYPQEIRNAYDSGDLHLHDPARSRSTASAGI